MDDQTKGILLELLKLDLGITHNLRDAYFNGLIESSATEIERMGVDIDYDDIADNVLIVDYAAWSYRKRQENIPISRNLMFRIKNRVIQKAGATSAES